MDDVMDVLSQDAVTVAEQLIGWRLYVTESDGNKTGGIIIETEAYNQHDAASHSFRGKTARNKVMFGKAGRIYVYFTYGMHWCLNVVTGPEGSGEAVLIRSIKIDTGVQTIKQRRNNRPYKELTNGPAKVCQALAVTSIDNGAVINRSRFSLTPPPVAIPTVASRRIGISKNKDFLWRFTPKG